MGLVKASTAPAAEAEPVRQEAPRLDHADPRVRRRAVEALADGAGHERLLVAHLQVEEDRYVREGIYLVLARLATAAAAEALSELLSSAEADLRNGALECLAAMPEQSAKLLDRLGGSDDPDVRIFAVMLSGELHADVVGDWLIRFVADEQDANVCSAAAEVMTEAGDPDAIPALEAIRDRFAGQPFIQFVANAAIGRLQAA